jgi:hypothetical protein
MARPVPDAHLYGLPVSVPCPFCGERETELHSPFGPQLSVATYWCRRCFAPFEFLKWGPRHPPADPPP